MRYSSAMRRALMLLAVAGCNQTFGLDQAARIDSALLDSVPDAAVTCPPTGGTPRFRSAITQAVPQPCSDYTISTASGRALASCYDDSKNLYGVYAGDIDAPLQPAIGFDPPMNYWFDYLRLMPDGQSAIARMQDPSQQPIFVTFDRSADGTWSRGEDFPIPSSYGQSLSQPSVTTPRHVLRYDGDTYVLEEFVEKPDGTWMNAEQYTLADLGVGGMSSPRMTLDALRMVFFGRFGSDDRIMIADRADPTQRFSVARPLDLPVTYDGFVTDDCRKFYFTAIGRVFYIEGVPP